MVGIRKGIDWKHVAISAAAGAVGGYYSQVYTPMVGAIAGNVASQGVAMMLGMQKRFDWRSVAVSAAVAGMNMAIDKSMNSSGPALSNTASTDGAQFTGFAADFATGIDKGTLSQGLRMAVYNRGKMDWANVAADAFGNTIGNSIVADMWEYREEAFAEMANQNQERYADEPGIASLPGASSRRAIIQINGQNYDAVTGEPVNLPPTVAMGPGTPGPTTASIVCFLRKPSAGA
jgi:hypothetical protein